MNINRRLEKEIQMLSHDPGPGISVWRESTSELRAQMTGPEDSPYEGGLFSLVLNIPDRLHVERSVFIRGIILCIQVSV